MPRGIRSPTAPLRRLLRQFGWRAGRRTGATARRDARGCRAASAARPRTGLHRLHRAWSGPLA